MTTSRANTRSDARFFALIPCAGQGSRAGTAQAKQYQLIAGRPMVKHTVEAFRALSGTFAALWVVVSPSDEEFLSVFPDYTQANEHLFRGGGATRAATVLNGLKAMVAQAGGATLDDWVLVHDAARCLVMPGQIQDLITACRDDAVGGLLAQKLPDTLKSEHGGRVASTIDRSEKWLAQTPQMFRIGMLIDALEKTGDRVTDESSAMEAVGLAPRLVGSSAENFKVTYPEDFALAEAIFDRRGK